MVKLIIKGNRSEAALELARRDIAILEDLKEIPSVLTPAIWTTAKVHDAYAGRVRAWFHESQHAPFKPGDLLSFTQTELAELGV